MCGSCWRHELSFLWRCWVAVCVLPSDLQITRRSLGFSSGVSGPVVARKKHGISIHQSAVCLGFAEQISLKKKLSCWRKTKDFC